MKKLIPLSLIGIILTSMVTSCSLEKHRLPSRLYASTTHTQKDKDYKTSNQKVKSEKADYFVESNTSTKVKKTNPKFKVSSSNDNRNTLVSESQLISSLDNDYSEGQNTSNKNTFYQRIISEAECDKIIFRNGNIIEAKVIKITEKEIVYKKCNNINGPTYTRSKSSIFMIQYANGTKDVFSQKVEESKNNKKDLESNSKTEESKLGEKKEKNKGSGAVASSLGFVFSILGLIFLILVMSSGSVLFLILSALFTIPGLILSIVGVSKGGNTWAKVGGIIGIIFCALILSLILVTIIAII